MSTQMQGEGAVQVEMPFAMVLGEPLTEMPRDLYIPPQAMEVFLDAFEGPLDLLLYLIRRQNLNILDIPIAEITRCEDSRTAASGRPTIITSGLSAPRALTSTSTSWASTPRSAAENRRVIM